MGVQSDFYIRTVAKIHELEAIARAKLDRVKEDPEARADVLEWASRLMFRKWRLRRQKDRGLHQGTCANWRVLSRLATRTYGCYSKVLWSQ